MVRRISCRRRRRSIAAFASLAFGLAIIFGYCIIYEGPLQLRQEDQLHYLQHQQHQQERQRQNSMQTSNDDGDRNSRALEPASVLKTDESPKRNIQTKVNNVTLTRKYSKNDTQSPESRLITIDHFGQLGNNMFQYAGLLGVARTNNRNAFILPKSLLARVFRVSNVKNIPGTTKWRLVGEPRYAMYDPWYESLPGGPLLLQCYFQSFKYFAGLEDVIRKQFQFLPSINQEANRVFQAATSSHKNSTKVGIHIRRGDKLSQKEKRSGERVPPASYFENAMRWMRDKYKNVLFLVTSDDMKWTKTKIKGPDVRILSPAAGPVHLNVLTQCDHVIMSVGSFGWWAGWLAGGDVIYYNQPLVGDSWKGQRFRREDYYPNSWVPLGD